MAERIQQPRQPRLGRYRQSSSFGPAVAHGSGRFASRLRGSLGACSERPASNTSDSAAELKGSRAQALQSTCHFNPSKFKAALSGAPPRKLPTPPTRLCPPQNPRRLGNHPTSPDCRKLSFNHGLQHPTFPHFSIFHDLLRSTQSLSDRDHSYPRSGSNRSLFQFRLAFTVVHQARQNVRPRRRRHCCSARRWQRGRL